MSLHQKHAGGTSVFAFTQKSQCDASYVPSSKPTIGCVFKRMKELPNYMQEVHPIHSCVPGLNSTKVITMLTSSFIMTSLHFFCGTMLGSAG
jgi:hypothetical protein